MSPVTGQCVGIDISEQNLALATQRFAANTALTFQQGNAEALPLPDRSVEAYTIASDGWATVAALPEPRATVRAGQSISRSYQSSPASLTGPAPSGMIRGHAIEKRYAPRPRSRMSAISSG